jgi:hypothetical protein
MTRPINKPLDSKTDGASEVYRGFHITYEPLPIPDRWFDWSYVSEHYDGAPDSRDRRCGVAASLEACKCEIDALLEDC